MEGAGSVVPEALLIVLPPKSAPWPEWTTPKPSLSRPRFPGAKHKSPKPKSVQERIARGSRVPSLYRDINRPHCHTS